LLLGLFRARCASAAAAAAAAASSCRICGQGGHRRANLPLPPAVDEEGGLIAPGARCHGNREGGRCGVETTRSASKLL